MAGLSTTSRLHDIYLKSETFTTGPGEDGNLKKIKSIEEIPVQVTFTNFREKYTKLSFVQELKAGKSSLVKETLIRTYCTLFIN